MRRIRIVPWLVALAVAVGCDEDDDLQGPFQPVDMTGVWTGVADGLVFELVLVQGDGKDRHDFDRDHRRRGGGRTRDRGEQRLDDGFEPRTLRGSGNIHGADVAAAVLIEGTNLQPQVVLTLATGGGLDADDGADDDGLLDDVRIINFLGRFIETEVVAGRLNGGGFVDEPLTLRFTRRLDSTEEALPEADGPEAAGEGDGEG